MPGTGVLAQGAQQGRGDGGRTGGLDAAQGHAGVFGFDDHTDALGLQVFGEPIGDLFGEPFLDLGATGEMLDDTGEFGQSEDAVTGQVSDVGDADERQQVVFAYRPQRDTAGEDEVVIGGRGADPPHPALRNYRT